MMRPVDPRIDAERMAEYIQLQEDHSDDLDQMADALHAACATRPSEQRNWAAIRKSRDGEEWLRRKPRMILIWSVAWERDQQPWVHLSISRLDIIPSYDDLTEVYRLFLGEDLSPLNPVAYMLFVPPNEHVNIHARCLHLWQPLYRRISPPFHGYEIGGGATI